MGSTSDTEFDFIIVGAGAAGCLLASRLARSSKRPSVLLVEAGGKNDSPQKRIDAERWIHRMNPGQNWGYQTVPQKHLDGSVIPYDRGLGLGGSTSVNFSVWTVGARDDYDELARVVGDSEWNWSNAQARFKRIESYKCTPPNVPENVEKYLSPNPQDHGSDGPIKVGFPKIWEKGMIQDIDVFSGEGIPLNRDLNSGNPIGLSLCPNSAYGGMRSTSADCLVDAPSNLEVLTDTEVGKVVVDGLVCVGIKTLSGKVYRASKEVILSCGSLDTPRVLMHSGIGPRDQLDHFDIPMVLANANVGQNLNDHHHVTFTFQRTDKRNDRSAFYKSADLQSAAREQWEKHHTGPLAEIGCQLGMAFLKLDSVLQSAEFEALDPATKRHLAAESVPSFEFIVNPANVENFVDPANTPTMATIFMFVLNRQSRGSVMLQSSDPKQSLLFDPNFLAHPYDRRLAIELTREMMRLTSLPGYAKDTVKAMNIPASDSDEDILAFWKKTTGSTWHMTGTCSMGKSADEAVVDKDLKVFGVERLRVADQSIYPVILNGHTQTQAYLAGLTLGDKLVEQYHLND